MRSVNNSRAPLNRWNSGPPLLRTDWAPRVVASVFFKPQHAYNNDTRKTDDGGTHGETHLPLPSAIPFGQSKSICRGQKRRAVYRRRFCYQGRGKGRGKWTRKNGLDGYFTRVAETEPRIFLRLLGQILVFENPPERKPAPPRTKR